MIEDILEYNNDEGVKESKHKHPTLKQVEKQMKGFDESLVLYVYHHMNGREDEARSYLAEWEEEQEELRQSFILKNDLKKINSLSITEANDNANQQHTTPDATGNTQE